MLYIVAPFETENFSKQISSRNLEFAKLFNGPVVILCSAFDHRYKKFNSFHESSEFVNNSATNTKLSLISTISYENNISLKRLLSNLLFSVNLSVYLIKHLKRDDKILINSIPPEILFFTSWIAKIKKSRLYVDVRDIWPDALVNDTVSPTKSKLFSAYCNFFYKMKSNMPIRGIQYVASSFQSWIDRHFPKNITRREILLGYDKNRWLDRTESDVSPPSKAQDEVRGVYIGYLNMQFDLTELLNSNIYRHSFLDIIGDGANKSRYKSLTKNNALNVNFHGMVAPSEISGIIESLKPDYAILPLSKTAKAMMPNKLFDYIALNIPIIVLNSEDAGRFVTSSNIGMYFQNVADFSKKVTSTSFIKELNEYRVSIQKAKENYSMQSLYKQALFIDEK